jgi:pimeloyl-ACP methyl ester carboxylesterase
VAAILRADGHEVIAVTLPGLGSVDADRSAITMDDHVEAICDAVRAAGSSVVLAAHSGAGVPGYGATDRVPDLIANMVYVDTGAGTGPLDADLEGPELPMPPLEQLREEENLDGLTDEQLARFVDLAVPEPAGAVREPLSLTNDARLDVASTVICTAFTAEQYREAMREGYPFINGLADLRDLSWVELPTSHWPMWSRPADLARIFGDLATINGS